jgi:hypothetical protein
MRAPGMLANAVTRQSFSLRHRRTILGSNNINELFSDAVLVNFDVGAWVDLVIVGG